MSISCAHLEKQYVHSGAYKKAPLRYEGLAAVVVVSQRNAESGVTSIILIEIGQCHGES